jgi:cellulose synthase/poly-beta-1,6-N-acetylglucosamine synthase-like glycosyltransferase
LTYLFYKNKKLVPQNVPTFEQLPYIPRVTIQLPIYNEKYVVERLVKQVCQIDYPLDKLEIQVLDDSTDETREITRSVVSRFQAKGVPIIQHCRSSRQGFKAGALQEGLKLATGEFIAVFDADFLPDADFLKKIMPYFFTPKKFGMVQARWGHLNQDYSKMTQAQSILLDGHFVIEHTARNRSGRFFNFNGTAGVWDKKCIEDAGGWEFDTLTEDLDLSYRAQMKGWKFLYVPEIAVPAELPVDINGFKAQQQRWAKGSIQTAKKLIPRLLKSPIPFKIKLEACFHLVNNLAYLLMVLLALLMPFSLYFREQTSLGLAIWIDLFIFVLATVSVGTFYLCSQAEIYSDWKSRLVYLPLNLALGIGLSISNSKAILEGLFNFKSEFNRTAKYAISKKSDHWLNKNYKSQIGLITYFEIFMGLYFTAAMVYALYHGIWMSVYCLVFFQIGFLYVGFLSFLQRRPLLSISPNMEASPAVVD